MTERMLHIFLFFAWPLIACLLLFCMALVCAVAWLVIPFGKPRMEGTSWTLDFPWSKK